MKDILNNDCNVQSLNLVELLESRAIEFPDRLAYSFLSTKLEFEEQLSYSDLAKQSRAIAALLQSENFSGNRAILVYRPGLSFLSAFFGCLYSGIIAVPVCPPKRGRDVSRFAELLKDTEASLVLTTDSLLKSLEETIKLTDVKVVKCIATNTVDQSWSTKWVKPYICKDSLAFLQYTSGSTRSPKGVMVSHSNLIHNLGHIENSFGHSRNSQGLIWLPLYHDMGLIGGVLQPLYSCFHVILMSPSEFVRNPLSWLRAISKYRITTSGGPNFAYDLCLSRVTEEQKNELDLSSWEVAFNGAEPIRPETITNFSDEFASSGFNRSTFHTCYGMAEATLMISSGVKSEVPRIEKFCLKSLGDKQVKAEMISSDNNDLRAYVGCGLPIDDLDVVIVDPENQRRLERGYIGEIWVSGSTVTKGYWKNTSETQSIFNAYLRDSEDGPFLRTGDLGFFHDEELFVTGRLKDLIIVRGVNYYPQDIEYTVENSHSQLKNNSTAAFLINLEGKEHLVVIQEIKKDSEKEIDTSSINSSIRELVAREHGLVVSGIILLKSGSIPKTTSGKVQRNKCKLDYIDGKLNNIIFSHFNIYSSINEDNEYLDLYTLSSKHPNERKSCLGIYLKNRVSGFLNIESSILNEEEPLIRFGMDSLVATQIQNFLQENFGLSSSSFIFYENLSIEDLVDSILDKIESLNIDLDASAHNSVRVINKKFPLSHGQKTLWFLSKLSPDSRAYTIVRAGKIFGEIEIEAFKKAFLLLLERHSMLRTIFGESNGEPFQIVQDQIEECFKIIDASKWSEKQIDEYINSDKNTDFSLEKGPLIQISLLTQSSNTSTIIFSIHHIITDFWSLSILVNELFLLYKTEKEGTKMLLNPISFEYSEYVDLESKTLASSDGEKLRSFWKQEFEGDLLAINLPIDRPRCALTSRQQRFITQVYSSELTHKSQELCRKYGVTLYTFLISVFYVLLYRLSNQNDLILATATHGRNRLSYSGVIGYFVNPIALRVNCPGNSRFEDFLYYVQDRLSKVMEHSTYPYALLVESLNPERDPEELPLTQVMFSFQKSQLLHNEGLSSLAMGYPGARFEKDSLTFESINLNHGESQFDIALNITESNEVILAKFEYDASLFDSSTIDRLANCYEVLLSTIVENPEDRISDLAILNDSETHTILQRFNNTQTKYSKNYFAHQLFEKQALNHPQNLAIISKSVSLTYGELNKAANQLAKFLLELNLGYEQKIGIYLDRSTEFVIAGMAVLKSCAVFVPLDPTWPQDRLKFCIRDSAISIVLTDSRKVDNFKQFDTQVIEIDSKLSELSNAECTNPKCSIVSKHLAYQIYTSGSTGTPKAVEIQHQGLINLIDWYKKAYHINKQDRITQIARPAFDASIFEIFPCLASGASLYIPEDELLLSPKYLVSWMVDCSITITFLPTPLAESLLLQSWSTDSSLRFLLTAGDRLKSYPNDSLPFKLVNHYGPTEYTVCTTFCRVSPKDANLNYLIPPSIGIPISNTRVYILDRNLQIAPIGVPGEIYISGDGIARGYQNRPSLTAEKFLPDPYTSNPGSRMYATGDIAKYSSSGKINFLHRKDAQVKVRGFRVELGEIEAQLYNLKEVQEAIVLAFDDELAGKRVSAFIVPENPENASSEFFRQTLIKILPSYMIPLEFILLNSLPKTINGKIDKAALLLTVSKAEEGRSIVTAKTYFEEILVDIWTDVLNLERVSIYDNFFEIGGHSLLAMQVVSYIKKTLNVDISVRKIFEAPTIYELSKIIRCNQFQRSTIETIPPSLVLRDQALPLSYEQQRLWFLSKMEDGSSAYNISVAILLSGKLDKSALENSLLKIIERHEVFQTRICTTDWIPTQQILNNRRLIIESEEIYSTSDEDQMEKIKAHAINHANLPFDLENDLLLRVKLIHLSEEKFVLLLSVHHIIFDGWSANIFVNELSVLYSSYVRKDLTCSPKIPIQYTDYVIWQRNKLSGEFLNEKLQHWLKVLEDAPPLLPLLTDLPRPPIQKYKGSIVTRNISNTLLSKIKENNRNNGSTLFMVFLSIFSVLLSRYCGEDDLVIGIPVANRSTKEIENLIGLFSNTLPLRIRLDNSFSFQQLILNVKQVCLDAYANQELPFELLVEKMQVPRSLSYHPIFQVMFSFENFPLEELQLPNLKLSELDIDFGVSKFDLTLSIKPSCDSLIASFEYNTDLFQKTTIERLADNFNNLLNLISDNFETRLTDISLVPYIGNHNNSLGYSPGSGVEDFTDLLHVHKLFENQVKFSPNSTALVFGETRLSYDELNIRVNQLANHIIELGFSGDVRIGILVERSVELIIAILSVLKSGNSFVPIDPVVPDDRLLSIESTSKFSLLITQSKYNQKSDICQARRILISETYDLSLMSNSAPVCSLMAKSEAYTIFTSGSTGLPKGVVISHESLASRAVALSKKYELCSDDKVLQFSSPSFDLALEEIFTTLICGATLVISNPELMTISDFLKFIDLHSLTVLNIPTSYWQELVSGIESLNLNIPLSLRLLIIGTEGASLKVLKQWQRIVNHDVKLFNAYGLTETTITAMLYEASMNLSISEKDLKSLNYFDLYSDNHSEERNQFLPIGKAIGGSEVYILDQFLNLLPIDFPGEIYIGGIGTASGYVNQPGLTSEKFLPDPFSTRSGSRMYKTGDIGYMLTDGNIIFTHRVDDQIKIRGYRVELKEIELNILKHPNISDAVVINAREANRNILIAFVSLKEVTENFSDLLREFLGKLLPSYMIPEKFQLIEIIPKTLSGKTDFLALKSQIVSDNQLGNRQIVAAHNLVQQTLVNLWKEILCIEEVSILDDFFDLGGHSILVVRLVYQIKEIFKVNLSLEEVFKAATIIAISKVIESKFGWQNKLDSQDNIDSDKCIYSDDSKLPDSICITNQEKSDLFEKSASILLTGSTGFLGAFILDELLKQSDAKIYCLVRANNYSDGAKRLRDNLQSYSLLDEKFDRVEVILGDLSEPLFGLPNNDYNSLASKVNIIYHCAASVNLIYPYSELRGPNVLGTIEIIKFAAHIKIKYLHYISTTSVFHPTGYAKKRTVFENTPLDLIDQVVDDGYARSKWVAEKLISEAIARGIPCKIYRTDVVSGHSETGIWNTKDIAFRLLKGWIQMNKAAYKDTVLLYLTPVNFLSKAIVYLSMSKNLQENIFHVMNPKEIDWNDMVDWLYSFGYSFSRIPYQQWQKELASLPVSELKDNAIFPFLPVYLEIEPPIYEPQKYDCTNMLDALTGSSITCPKPNELLEIYLRYFINQGLIEPPQILK